MENFNKYRVLMTIESDGDAKDDPEIGKEVMASTPEDALSIARTLLKNENPDVNHMKVWAWAIEEMRD